MVPVYLEMKAGECLKNKNMCSPLSDGAAEVNSIVERHFSNLVNNEIKKTEENNPEFYSRALLIKKILGSLKNPMHLR